MVASIWVVLGLFLLVIAAALMLAAVVSPWLFWWLKDIYDFPFHRIFNRTAILVFVIGTSVLLFKLRLHSKASLGYSAPPRRFLGLLGSGFVCGVVLMSLVSVALLALGARLLRPDLDISVVLSALPAALLSGIAVGFIEETIFRGALYSAARRHSSGTAAAVVVSLLYAIVHFLGEKTRIASHDVNSLSGLVVLSHFFDKFSRPLEIVDALLALFLVGVLLARIREVMGNIAPCVGLHAGFVASIALTKKVSVPAFDSPFGFLISHIDGVIGWLVAGATLITVYVWHELTIEQVSRKH